MSSESVPPTANTATDHPILVLGMHRSGTSALARVLEMMGAWIGDYADLIPAHPVDNPTGYWERTDLLIEHDKFLEKVGYAWDKLADFDANTLDPVASKQFISAVTRILATLEPGGKPWLIKDPRLCLLLPLWRNLITSPVPVIAVRDPQEIAASLHQSHRGGYPTPFLFALWEKYMRNLLASLHGESAVFVSYSRLVAHPEKETRRLLEALQTLGVPHLHTAEPEALQGFLSGTLRRSEANADIALSQAQSDLYEWLLARTADPGAVAVSDYPEASPPDALLQDYQDARIHQDNHVQREQAQPVTSRLDAIQNMLAAEHNRVVADLSEQRSISAQHLNRANSLQKLSDSLARQLAEAQSEAEDTKAQIIQDMRDARQRQRELAHLDHERRRLASEADMIRAHADERERIIHALKRSVSWRLTAPLRFIIDLLFFHIPAVLERIFYHIYYAIPGLGEERKRAMIVWLHDHVPVLTRHTLSYRMLEKERQLNLMRNVPKRMDAKKARKVIAELEETPLISIVMPVYNVDPRWLSAAVDSVRNQYYPNWELCIADDASTKADTIKAIEKLKACGDERIRIKQLEENQGIARASNAALAMAKGEYVGFLDNDDELTRDALLEVARRIVADAPDIVYSDEDKLNAEGGHFEPHFKPDFSQELLFSYNYLCHFTLVRRSILNEIGGFRREFDSAQDYDLFLRASEKAKKISHIPLVLYHWRVVEGSTAAGPAAKPESLKSGRTALAESLQRRGIQARIEDGPLPTTYCVRRHLKDSPLVSILIPFRDNAGLLKTCVTSIQEKSTYQNYEIVGIDNGSVKERTHELMRDLAQRDSRIRFVRHDIPFNYSSIINFGVTRTKGEHLLMLNDDTEIISSDWIEAMLEHSVEPETGVVGAKLLYPDDTIQHGGVIIGLGGVAGHAHLQLPADHLGYFLRPQLIQNVSAVTFACAMTKRSVFDEVGGLNERNLTIAYNDIDYCLRVREAGYGVIYTPCAVLYHHESKSRGYEDTPEKQARYAREIQYMQVRHADILTKGDPFYNVNLSLTSGYLPHMEYIDSLPGR